jgi:diguanylate cyclase (GGDEF)-like protein
VTSARLINARRDAIVLAVLITAVMLLIWNGSEFFHNLRIGGTQFGPEVRLASTALTLNVALILFGWRRYVDLQHEAEMREEHERRAVVLATTDAITGLYNRKGFADRAAQLCIEAAERGDNLVVISFQVHRFKTINDQHGYETGDRLLKTLSVALADELGPDAVLARLSGDEFAVALALAARGMRRADELAEAVLRIVTRPLLFDEKIIQVGAFAGIASAAAVTARIPDLLRRADIAMDRARSGRAARPVWFDAAMERALIAHGEIEQGIRFGLEWAGNGPEEPLAQLLDLGELLFRRGEGHGELVARKARHQMTRPDALLQGGGDHAQHTIADVIAVTVVHRLEPVELEREDDQRLAGFRGRAAELFAPVSKTLAVEQAGHSIGRCDQRGAGLALFPHLRLMLKVDIAAPAEQDQRDVQGQRYRSDLQARPKLAAGEGKALEKFAAVPDKHDDGGNEDAKHQHVPPRIGERHVPVPRRGLRKQKTAHME